MLQLAIVRLSLLCVVEESNLSLRVDYKFPNGNIQ